VIELDRPPVNALGRDLVEEIIAVAKEVGDDPASRAAIVRSAGKHFCAGADLKERKEMTVEEVRRFVPRIGDACSALAAIPCPVIAAVRGAAAGGGCELALACDLRVLADDVRIGLPETTLAIIPGGGGTQRLARLVGPARAKRWVMGGAMHDAAQALADGVADRVVPAGDLDRVAEEVARGFAANGPVAVRAAKRAIDRGLDLELRDALRFEFECYEETLGTTDRVEALRAFAEKRPPRFRGA
jgi:enoyl-CoA hydratase/carnithine racemase